MAAWFNTALEWDRRDRLWVTYVHGLGGISTYGETLEEVLSQTRVLISGYLETAQAEGIALPSPTPESLVSPE